MKGTPPTLVMQLLPLVFSGISLLGGFWVYCEAHFAHADVVKIAFDNEIEYRKELKAEIDALYLHSIPPPERAPLKHYERFE